MGQKELKEHFQKADEVVLKGISESKHNFNVVTDIIQKSYSELNKGEILVAAGAFSLIVSFLIQKNNEISYNQTGFLKFSVCLLFFVIVWKFHLSRTAVKRAETERDLIHKSLGILTDIQVANTQFLVNGNANLLLKTPKIIEDLEVVEKKLKMMNSPQSKFRGNLLNEVEYVAFFSGTALLLIFFLFNI